MNEMITKLSLVEDKFMSEKDVKQSRFIYSSCGTFTKTKTGIQNFKESGDSKYIYENELNNVCLQRDMASGDIEHLIRRTVLDKVFHSRYFLQNF